ncbi:MAG: hypothetical protein IPM13_08495 [Phycisphaerales bacterium]|nr:hypothetical protein [Phycisphaerales bacterium]
MSLIPPNWLGSILGAPGASQRAGSAKATEDASASTTRGPNSFADNLMDVIESSERDSQVYTDAEGSGSQGRPSEPETQEAPSGDEPAADTDDGLDIEA